MKNIFSIFAQTSNIKLLILYLKRALELNIIDEVHIWNYTSNTEDEKYLRSICNIQRTTSISNGKYIEANMEILNNHITFHVISQSDAHIKFLYKESEYELVLGAHSNTRSVLRANRQDICIVYKKNVVNSLEKTKIDIYIDDAYHQMYVKINDKLFMCIDIDVDVDVGIDYESKRTISDICVKTGFGSVGYFYYKTIDHPGFYFMDTCVKDTYNDMYEHYSADEHSDDVIITCDNSIAFIDLCKLRPFIHYVRMNGTYPIVFPSIINNSIVSYYMQNKYELIGENIFTVYYPERGYIFDTGPIADIIHDYFLKNYTSFLDYDYEKEVIPIYTDFDLQFFAYKGVNWEHNIKYQDKYSYSFSNALYSDLCVLHLKDSKKLFSGIDVWINTSKWFSKYMDLCTNLMDSRFSSQNESNFEKLN